MGVPWQQPKPLTPPRVTRQAAQSDWTFYHGTPDERTWDQPHGAAYGLHVGTEESARQALNARIGRPLEGDWDGTREYGKTLLSPYQTTGGERNLEAPRYPSGRATYSTGHQVPMDARPSIFPVRITGPMTNHPAVPMEDAQANGRMRAQITRGQARRGYFYRNTGEDEGSISAVVPSAAHLERVHPPKEARWTPSSGIFGPTTGLDADLFDEHGRLRPGVAEEVMQRLDRCIRTDSGLAGSDWQDWTRVYLLGGSVSEWAGPRPNGTARDLDVITAIDLRAAQGHNAFEGMDPGTAASALNAAFHRHFNDDHWRPSFGGVWSLTAFCNMRAWDVTAIRPYAAYDLTHGRWSVKPPHLPEHSVRDFDPAVIAHAQAVLAEARAVLRMAEPLRSREARDLWEHVHAHRCAAFSQEGTGWDDPGNVDEKALAYAPRGTWAKIRELALSKTAAAQNPPCHYCGEPLDDDDVDNGISSHEECSHMRWCEAHQEHHDDPMEAEGHNDTYTDWHGHLPFGHGIHRGFPKRFSAEVHRAIHDESRSVPERAAILREHLNDNPSEGMGLQRRLTDEEKYGQTGHFGVHWTDSEPHARGWAEDDMYEGPVGGGPKPSVTHVVLHAASPDREHIEDDPEELERRHMYGFDHDRSEREVPLKVGAPVRLTGISWKYGGESEWSRHDFSDGNQVTAAAKTAAPQGYLRNPYHGTPEFGGRPEWSHTWFHGTRGEPDFGTRRKYSDEAQRAALPPEQRKMNSGWTQPNQHLGVHLSPLHEVGHKFAPSTWSGPTSIAHVRLRGSDPAHFETEDHLNIAMADWAQRHYPHWHDDKLNGSMAWNYSDQEGTHRDFSQVPDDPGQRWRMSERAQSLLTWHPHMPEILSGFKAHLRAQGHHGITYGNGVEGPYDTDATRGGDASTKAIMKHENWPRGAPKSISAIADPEDIEVTHVEHIAPWRAEPEPHQRTWEDVSDSDEPDEMRDRILNWHRERGGRLPARLAAWHHDTSGSDNNGVYLRFGRWPENERSFSPAGGYHEEGVSAYDLDKHGDPSIGHGLDRGHEHDEGCEDDCDLDTEGPDNDPREEMQGRVRRAEKNRRYDGDKRDNVGHLVRGEMSGVGYDGEPLLKNVRRVGDWIDHRHLFLDQAHPHHLARDPDDPDYEEPEEKPPYGDRNARTASAEEDEEPYYHVSPFRLPRGTMLRPGVHLRGNFDESTSTHVHMTKSRDRAEQYRYLLWEQGHPEQHMYEVEPHGPVEPDPADHEAVRTQHPVEVIHAPDFDPESDESEAESGWFNGHTAAMVTAAHPGLSPWMQWAAAEPHKAVIHQAQGNLREEHPELAEALDHRDPDDLDFIRNGESREGGRLLGSILRAAGHPGADSAWVMPHPSPKGSSQVAVDDKGNLGAVLLPSRWNRGTLAHEGAHLTHAREAGIDLAAMAHGESEGSEFRTGVPDHVMHGPDFARHYANALDVVSPGAGDDFLRHHANAVALIGNVRHRFHGLPREFEGSEPIRREAAQYLDESGQPVHWGHADDASSSGTAKTEHETWYHLTDNPHFHLNPEHAPADNSFSIEDRSGQRGIYLGKSPEHWFSGAGEGYARPYLAEFHVHPSVKEAPGVHGRWGGEMFVPAEHSDKLKLHRVIPVDAYVRESYGTHGWIEQHHGSEFDTGKEIERPGFSAPLSAHYPFKERVHEAGTWRYPGPDVRDMTPEQHNAHRDRWLHYLKHDRGFSDEDVADFRQDHDKHLPPRTASAPSGVSQRPRRTPGNAMVYLDVPHGTVQPYAGQEGGHHIALAYLPRSIGDEDFARVVDRAREAATRHAPMKGVIGGHMTFPPGASSDKRRAAVVPADIPGVHGLQREFGEFDRAHYEQYTPHVTRAQLTGNDPDPEPHPPVRVPFTHVHVRRGEEVHSFPLTGGSRVMASMEVPSTLYHVSPRSNRDSIREQGLLPEYAEGPEAVYLHERPGTGAKRGDDTWRVDTAGLSVARDPHEMCKDPRCEFRGEGSWYTGDAVPSGRLTLHSFPLTGPNRVEAAGEYRFVGIPPVGGRRPDKHRDRARAETWQRIDEERRMAEQDEDDRYAEHEQSTLKPWAREAVSGYDGLTKRSGMIYLDLPPGTVRSVPGGVDDHHITLVYLGSDVDDEAFEEACRRTRAAAAKCPPMEGVLRGIDIFPPGKGSDGKVVAFAPAYVGGIGRLRRELEDLSASEHKDYRPHVTLASLEEGDGLPAPHPAVPLRFTHVHVKRGNDVVSFPLTGRVHE